MTPQEKKVKLQKAYIDFMKGINANNGKGYTVQELSDKYKISKCTISHYISMRMKENKKKKIDC